MKRRTHRTSGISVLEFALLAFLVVGLWAQQAHADPRNGVKGFWADGEGDSTIEIYVCGDFLCGRVVALADPLGDDGKPLLDVNNRDKSNRERPVVGLVLLSGFSYDATKRAWRGGRIYDPRNGKTYKSTMAMKDDGTLGIRGYIGISLIGRTDIWMPATTPATESIAPPPN